MGLLPGRGPAAFLVGLLPVTRKKPVNEGGGVTDGSCRTEPQSCEVHVPCCSLQRDGASVLVVDSISVPSKPEGRSQPLHAAPLGSLLPSHVCAPG